LLSNAIKYSSSGGRVIVSVAEEQSAAENTLVVKVTDKGAGIPEEDLSRIFDRFYQADDHIAKTGGTGVGLALTKELINLMEGTIVVESELGKGTTFTVRLPVVRSAEMAESVPKEGFLPTSSKAAKLPITSLKKDEDTPRLLIIEDNADVVEYMASFLGNYYHLDLAYNGKIGIEKALENVPDIIISDVMMPEKDGFEVCEALKNDERTSHIPIVLLTAKADVESRIAGLKRGADDYLKKPFNQQELLAVLANRLEIRKKLQNRYLQLSNFRAVY